MIDYKEKLLKELIEKYRNSKKDRGENKINRSTKISPQKLYKKYNANDGNLVEIEHLNQAIIECHEQGFVSYKKVRFSYEIKEIILIDEAVDTIEAYLKQNYHFITKYDKFDFINRLIHAYEGSSTIVDEICKELHAKVEKHQIPNNYLKYDDLLKALAFIENNKEELFLREASMLIYGSSKYLEEFMLHDVCKTIRHYQKTPSAENEMEDEILHEYYIKKEPQRICMKGNCIIHTSDGEIDVSLFKYGIEFSSGELVDIKKITLHDSRLLTIENKTAYHRYHANGTTVFYLGGYMSRFQRDFLCLIKACNQGIVFEHFGDIDAGGFFIFEQLCAKTGIKFTPFCMGVDQLSDEHYKSCLQKLTDHDVVKLKNLQKLPIFQKQIAYMLQNNIKLEQEIICYYLMENPNKI